MGLGRMRALRWFLPITLLIFSASMLFAPYVSADLPQIDAGGSETITLNVQLLTDTDLVESGKALTVMVRVSDRQAIPVYKAVITIRADGATIDPSSGYTDYDGLFSFSYLAAADSETNLLLIVRAEKQGTYGGFGYMVTVVIPPSDPHGLNVPIVPAVGLTILASLGVASTEFGKYGLFKFLIFPLYTRLKKEEVLDHFVRGQIYGYIQANPGTHFNLLRNNLKVNNGTLAHHLRTLEVQGFIKSKRDGIFKRFYPIDVQVPTEEGIRLSDLQARILEMVNDGSGSTQAEIAKRLNVSQQAISYNLRLMSHEGMVLVEKTGREKRYFTALV